MFSIGINDIGIDRRPIIIPGGGGGGGPSQSLDYVEVRTATAAGTVTHNDVSFGDEPEAGETRFIIAALAWNDLSFTRTVTGVTIGGVAAERLVRAHGDSQFRNSELWMAEVPSGLSGAVVITGIGNRSAVSIYRMIDPFVDAAVGSSATIEASQNGPATLSVSEGDLVIAVTNVPSVGDITWTGLDTEDHDTSAGTSNQGSSGRVTTVADGNVNLNSSPLSGRTMAAVSFRGPNTITDLSVLKSAIFIQPDASKVSATALKSAFFIQPDNTKISASAVKSAVFVKPV